MPLLLTRCSAMGDKDKKINVFYPANNVRIEKFFNFIVDYYGRESKILNFFGVKENQTILDITSNHQIITFKTNHTEDSLGYCLVENRQKLKKEFEGQNIKELLKANKDLILNEPYQKKLFSYAVDAALVNPEDVKDSKVLFVDSTFLNSKDRSEERLSHFTIEEAYDLGKQSNCEHIVFMHLSSRYSWEQFATYIENSNYKQDFKSVKIINPKKINFVDF